MNAIFLIIILVSLLFLLFTAPNLMLEVFSSAPSKAIELSIFLIGVYTVWQGFSLVLEKSGLSNIICKAFKTPIKKLFKVNDDETIYQISLNVTGNMMGLSGIATPAGIKAMELLDKNSNEDGKTLLMVISSTSVQILPLSVIQMVSSYSGNVFSTVIVTLISTIFSTLVGIIICKVIK